MCSTTRGPAIWPSLVTWPTRITAAPVRLAKRISSPAEPRTCVTVPGDSFDSLRPHGLDRVDDQKLRRYALRQCRDDIFDRCFGRDLDRGFGQAEPFGAQPHLSHRLFAGNVDGAVLVAREGRRNVEQQRRFADSRIAAEQEYRAAHQTAAGHAVEFGNAGRQPRRFIARAALDLFDRERPSFARRAARPLGAFLDDRIPFAARLRICRPSAASPHRNSDRRSSVRARPSYAPR